ncbi:MAG: hypothetical protein IPK26_10165 [Planctomycetes bacterium]|nr:hypothetical protein [Planctomycetota bacterium]
MPTRAPARRHDPDLIESLLSARDRDGTSLARLAVESGIPCGTLSYWSWRRRQRSAATRPAFAEMVVREEVIPGKACVGQRQADARLAIANVVKGLVYG